MDIMIYSKSSIYGIQAMIYLAEHREESKIIVSKISENYNIPPQFLSKLVQTLAKHHLIDSFKGRNGGIRLHKDPKNIKIIDIVHAIDGPPPEQEMCVIGLDVCDDSVACPLHNNWKIIKENITSMLSNENLDTLTLEMLRKRKALEELVY